MLDMNSYYSNPANVHERTLYMREAVREMAHQMVESGYDTSFVQFDSPVDVAYALRDLAELFIGTESNPEPMWVHIMHSDGFINIDMQSICAEFQRAYNSLSAVYETLAELEEMGAIVPHTPADDGAEDPINVV